MNTMNIEKPFLKILEISKDNTYGKFQFEPLERGFGTTVGNAIRRVLLQAIPGVAATSVKIDGVDHEFSSVKGMKEDVAELILNLKELAIIMLDGDEGKLYIDATGPMEIKGRDIKTTGEVSIINKDLHIATLNEDTSTFIELTIARGRGYVSATENRENLPKEIGLIPMDSIYTPIRKVNYYVENTRVGQITDYDKLILEIWTNGTIAPDQALGVASIIFKQHLEILSEIADEQITPVIQKEMVEVDDDFKLDLPIEELDFSVRLFNCVKRANIHTVRDLVSKTETEIVRLKNLGKKSLDELMEKVKELGLSFKAEE